MLSYPVLHICSRNGIGFPFSAQLKLTQPQRAVIVLRVVNDNKGIILWNITKARMGFNMYFNMSCFHSHLKKTGF